MRSVTLLGVLLLSLLTTPAIAQYWKWSPKADHHSAVCRIDSDQGSGSGVYVKSGNFDGILTAYHVVQGSATAAATFQNGEKVNGPWTYDKYGYDVAFIYARPSKVTPVPLAGDTNPGARVEYTTFGGPSRSTLRHFYATLTASGNADGAVTYGDSGGPIFVDGALLSVQSSGVGDPIASTTTGPGATWDVFRTSSFAPGRAVRSFFQRVAAGPCPGGSCPYPGRLSPGPGRAPGGGIDFYPPSNPAPGPSPGSPGQVVDVQVDYGKLAEALVDNHIDKLRGPKGEPGRDGTPANLDYDRLASEVSARLPPISVKVDDGEGSISELQSVHLGGTLTLPPVRMEIEYPDNGDVKYQSKPLGEPIRLRLVPLHD